MCDFPFVAGGLSQVADVIRLWPRPELPFEVTFDGIARHRSRDMRAMMQSCIKYSSPATITETVVAEFDSCVGRWLPSCATVVWLLYRVPRGVTVSAPLLYAF